MRRKGEKEVVSRKDQPKESRKCNTWGIVINSLTLFY